MSLLSTVDSVYRTAAKDARQNSPPVTTSFGIKGKELEETVATIRKSEF